LSFLLVLAGCTLMAHTKNDKYLNLMYIALGILICLEFKGNINVYKTMDVLADILIWITIAIPTIYFAFKKDIRNIAVALAIPVIFILMGLIYTFAKLLNYI
jgi:threonine/homoserine efflux transporter RhtA